MDCCFNPCWIDHRRICGILKRHLGYRNLRYPIFFTIESELTIEEFNNLTQ